MRGTASSWLSRKLHSERPVTAVPRPVLWLLGGALLLQLTWHGIQPPLMAQARDLPRPPSEAVLRVAALGDPVALGRGLMLWLQVFDNQPGVSIPFVLLNYDHVATWLERILDLDPRSQYPLLAAARLYGEVPDPERQRRMMAFVYQKFMADPNNRWRWLAHASIVAKHRLKDPALALKFARAIADNTDAERVPPWARQMHIFLLEDAGELEAARTLIGGLLASGEIRDPHEIRFLQERLEALERQEGRQGTTRKGASEGETQ